jgi:hypothetical protein
MEQNGTKDELAFDLDGSVLRRNLRITDKTGSTPRGSASRMTTR